MLNEQVEKRTAITIGGREIIVETGEVAIPFADVRGAKLVLTDDLIAATTKAQEED